MWIQLTPAKLLASLSGREAATLSAAALGDSQTDALSEIAAIISDEWRGGLRRVTVLDSRTGFIPSEILIHILADFRYRAFTRLPGMAELLDDRRVAEWVRANQIRDNLHKVSILPPDAANTENPETSGKPGPAIADPDTASILGW